MTTVSAPTNEAEEASVSGLRQSERPISMGAVKFQSLQLSIERGAAHPERPGRSGDVAIGTRQRALPDPAFGGGEVFRPLPRRTEKVGCGERFLQAGLRNPKRLAGPARSPDDEIVRIDRNQGSCALVGDDQDARLRIRLAKIFSLDPSCGVVCSHRDQIDETFCLVRPARRYVERRDQMPLMVIDGGGRTTEPRVARQKMLLAMDRHGTLLDQTRADAIGAFAFFAPVGSRP